MGAVTAPHLDRHQQRSEWLRRREAVPVVVPPHRDPPPGLSRVGCLAEQCAGGTAVGYGEDAGRAELEGRAPEGPQIVGMLGAEHTASEVASCLVPVEPSGRSGRAATEERDVNAL